MQYPLVKELQKIKVIFCVTILATLQFYEITDKSTVRRSRNEDNFY